MLTIIYCGVNVIINMFRASNNVYRVSNEYDYTPYHLILTFANYFEAKCISNESQFYAEPFPLWIVGSVSVIFAVLFFVLNVKKKAEDTSDVSTEWYTYKLLMPVYTLGLYLIVPYTLFYAVLIAIAAYVGYVIFNRSFKLRIPDLIVMCSCIFAGTAFSIMMMVMYK